MFARVLVFLALAVILAVPFLARRGGDAPVDEGERLKLIVMTPHVSQIREEFATAFDKWHRREHGVGVEIDYRTPGGTSEIVRVLQAQFTAGVRDGRYTIGADGEVGLDEGVISYDLMFGGGTYDHGRLKSGVDVETGDEGALHVPISAPAGFEQAQLDEWFGENVIGAGQLYDDEQYWVGTALSSFGIVYNRDVLERVLGRRDIDSFDDLGDPRMAGWVALADPNMSGSVTTTLDAILSNYGWEHGWQTLRAMCANTRYFTNSSTKPPIDVSLGDAAAGLAIDFYGRGQAQSVLREGETPTTGRVGYADPAGAVFIDPDPISLIRSGPNPELARRFVEFVLSNEGQAIWNFRATTRDGADNPRGPDGLAMGPERHELRRMPVRRSFYEDFGEYNIDQVNPYEIASTTPSAGWRSSIGIMMGAFAVNNFEAIKGAWEALHAEGVPADVHAEMERVFYAFPTGEQVERLWRATFEGDPPADAVQGFTPETYRAVRGTWRDAGDQARLKVVYTLAFRENYERVEEMAEAAREGAH